MKLYTGIGPNPRVVRMFLAEKGVEIPQVEVDLLGGENRREPYLDKNSAGQLPSRPSRCNEEEQRRPRWPRSYSPSPVTGSPFYIFFSSGLPQQHLLPWPQPAEHLDAAVAGGGAGGDQTPLELAIRLGDHVGELQLADALERRLRHQDAPPAAGRNDEAAGRPNMPV